MGIELEERVTKLEERVEGLEKGFAPIPPKLDDFEKRIRALEEHKPIKEKIKMGQFNYDGEGKLIEITEDNQAFNYGEHSLGCIINDYNPSTDGTTVTFEYTVNGQKKTNTVNIKKDEGTNQGRAYVPISWIESNSSDFKATLKTSVSATIKVNFNPKPVSERPLHFGRTKYDSREVLG